MPNEFVIRNGFISKGNSIVEGGITATTISASTYSNLPSPSITVGTSQLTSGTDTRVLFQSGTTLQQDGNFTFDPTLKRLTLKAVGTAATDIAFRVRNSVDNDNLIESAGNGLIKFRTGTERIEINTSAADYKMSLYKFSVEMTKLSTYSSYFCVGGTGQFLGVGISAPSHLLDVNKLGDQKFIIARFGNQFNDTNQSDVSLKFTTAYCGGQFGGNPLGYLTVGHSGGSGVNLNAKSYFKFELLKNNTLSERASITSQSNFLLQTPTEDTNDVGVIYVPNGTVPTSGITDGYKQYSADITAGNAAPHFRTENGSIVKLYQETTGVTTSTLISNAGTTITDTDTFDGYTLQQVVKALRNLGVLQ